MAEIKTYQFGSMRKNVSEWSEATGIKKSTLKSRLLRSNDDPVKIKLALTLGASEEFLASLNPNKPVDAPKFLGLDEDNNEVFVGDEIGWKDDQETCGIAIGKKDNEFKVEKYDSITGETAIDWVQMSRCWLETSNTTRKPQNKPIPEPEKAPGVDPGPMPGETVKKPTGAFKRKSGKSGSKKLQKGDNSYELVLDNETLSVIKRFDGAIEIYKGNSQLVAFPILTEALNKWGVKISGKKNTRQLGSLVVKILKEGNV